MAQVDPGLRADLRRLVTGELPWPLFLHGEAGTGKTCAALCLLDHAGGDYHTAIGLAETLVEAQQGRLEWNDGLGYGGTLWPADVWRKLGRAPLVVLDELGIRATVSDHQYDAVKKLIDLRHGRPLVVVSNLDLIGLKKLYDDRITSRLAQGTVLSLGGPDRRLAGR